MDRPHWPGKNRRLFPPSLPAAAQVHLQQLRQSRINKSESENVLENAPRTENNGKDDVKDGDDRDKSATDDDARPPTPPAKDPIVPYQVPKAAANDKLVASKYVGRALAEWALIVAECDSFFARRRDEGVPCDRLVETPTLGVENFKK